MYIVDLCFYIPDQVIRAAGQTGRLVEARHVLSFLLDARVHLGEANRFDGTRI